MILLVLELPSKRRKKTEGFCSSTSINHLSSRLTLLIIDLYLSIGNGRSELKQRARMFIHQEEEEEEMTQSLQGKGKWKHLPATAWNQLPASLWLPWDSGNSSPPSECFLKCSAMTKLLTAAIWSIRHHYWGSSHTFQLWLSSPFAPWRNLYFSTLSGFYCFIQD